MEAQLQPGQRLLLTTAGHCDCGTALGAFERKAALLERRRRSDERKEASLRRRGWGESRIQRWRNQQQKISSGHDPQAGLIDWERLLIDMLSQPRTPYVGLLLHWYGGVSTSRSPCRAGYPCHSAPRVSADPRGRSHHFPGRRRGWAFSSAGTPTSMNRPTAALPWWLLTREGTFEEGDVLPSSAMHALGNQARCCPAASGANLALATGLGFPARALLDQLLCSPWRASSAISSSALLPSSSKANSDAAQWRLGVVHLFEVALKQGERAWPPGVPTNLAPTALNSRGALPPAMPAGVAVPRELDHYGERQRAVELARGRSMGKR